MDESPPSRDTRNYVINQLLVLFIPLISQFVYSSVIKLAKKLIRKH